MYSPAKIGKPGGTLSEEARQNGSLVKLTVPDDMHCERRHGHGRAIGYRMF